MSDLSRPADALLGQTIDGRYRVEVQVGEGGQGVVYRGVQINVDRAVAIKVLRLGASQDADVVRRFESEARIISALRHPNTLKLIDFGRLADGRLFLVTEFLHGRSLADVLAAGPIAPARALNLMAQVCGALDEAHREGIIHRDLKPANIFVEQVGSEEVGKVLDFGVAKLATQTIETAQGMILGTPLYMSPEQARGERVDARTDLYSLGVVLFQALGGAPPFEGENAYSVLNKHVHAAPPSLADVNPSLLAPAQVEQLVKRLLSKEADDRPPTAAAARTLLLGALRHLQPHGAGGAVSDGGARTMVGSASEGGLSPVDAAPRGGRAGKVAAIAGGVAFVIGVGAFLALREPSPAAVQPPASVADAGGAVPTAPAVVDAAPPAVDAAVAADAARPVVDAAVADAAPPADAGAKATFDQLVEGERWAEAVALLAATPALAEAVPEAARDKVQRGFADAELKQALALVDSDRPAAEAIAARLEALPYAEAQAAALKKALEPPKKKGGKRTRKRNPAKRDRANRANAANEPNVNPANVNPADRGEGAKSFDALLQEGISKMGSDNAGSVRAFLAASRLKPGAFQPHQRLCRIYQAMGNRAAALRHCQAWLKTEPRTNFHPMIQRQIDGLK